MADPVFSSLEECFSELPDPRVQGRCDHKLIDLIIITVCAVICGADSWTGVETFARAKELWLKRHLELPNGIPSHDTLGRVFASLNAEAFQAGFSRWVETVFRVTKGQVVAIDGKPILRRADCTIPSDPRDFKTVQATCKSDERIPSYQRRRPMLNHIDEPLPARIRVSRTEIKYAAIAVGVLVTLFALSRTAPVKRDLKPSLDWNDAKPLPHEAVQERFAIFALRELVIEAVGLWV